MSGQFGTRAEVSRPPANFFATIGRTEEKFNITRYYYYYDLYSRYNLHNNTSPRTIATSLCPLGKRIEYIFLTTSRSKEITSF